MSAWIEERETWGTIPARGRARGPSVHPASAQRTGQDKLLGQGPKRGDKARWSWRRRRETSTGHDAFGRPVGSHVGRVDSKTWCLGRRREERAALVPQRRGLETGNLARPKFQGLLRLCLMVQSSSGLSEMRVLSDGELGTRQWAPRRLTSNLWQACFFVAWHHTCRTVTCPVLATAERWWKLSPVPSLHRPNPLVGVLCCLSVFPTLAHELKKFCWQCAVALASCC